MHIIDEFLDEIKFNALQNIMVNGDLSWFFSNDIDSVGENVGRFQFFHIFYQGHSPNSDRYNELADVIEKLNPHSLVRIKANLLTKTTDIVKNTFHHDIDLSKKKLKQWTTSILYMNSNNGYTEFEDGTKIDSVANRMVIFPSDLKHRGTSCTDEKVRVIINFNYFDRHL